MIVQNYDNVRVYRIGTYTTSDIEIKDLLKAWVVISIAFGIVLIDKTDFWSILISFIFASLTVGAGFLLHELAHKIMAQRYHLFAEFRAFDNMLILGLILSIFGIVFVAPGAVMIHGPLNSRQNGKISLMGPLVNMVLAGIFIVILLVSPWDLLTVFAGYGAFINSWLGLFNLIPFFNFDGKKIYEWDKVVYFVALIVAIVLLVLSGRVGTSL